MRTSAPHRELVVGTRGSALALAQTTIVCDALRGLSRVTLRVERIATRGDVRGEASLAELGRGVFVTEIETALRDGRIDFAVHSAKDLPSALTDDVTIAAFLPRADARDVLVSRAGALSELPSGARVGTSSPRRMCQLRALRPDLELREMRGNVDTRLRKLAAGEFDAILLAAAGLIRLGRAQEATEWLDVDRVIPCVGQGALAVQARAGDDAIIALLGRLDCRETRAAVTAERAFLAELGAGCRAAAAAFARVVDGEVRIRAMLGSTDGREMTAERAGSRVDAAHVGASVARDLLRKGAASFFAIENGPLHGQRIAITRAADQSRELMELLRARGALPFSAPTIAIEPPDETGTLDASLSDMRATHWVVFTSANAVRAVADRLRALDVAIPRSVRLAAVGGATGEELATRIRPPDFVPTAATAETLAEELPDVIDRLVLVPHGDLAADTLPDTLRERGARVRAIIAYRTLPGPGVDVLVAELERGGCDAIVFASPSSIRFAAAALAAARRRSAQFPVVVCIGPTTARAAREAGFDPSAVARTAGTGGIVEALESCFSNDPNGETRAAASMASV